MKNIIGIIVSFLLPILSFADRTPYTGIVELRIESEKYIVFHYHNWSSTTRESREKMIFTHQNPFDSSNDYAYILCIDKSTNDTVFKSPSPALTQIKLSVDEEYIVGISKIKSTNPYQFVLFRTTGLLVKKQHITRKEAKLTKKEIKKFARKFSEQYNLLDSLDTINKIGEFFFIDFARTGMSNKLGKAWSYLMKFYSRNHLSPNFSESVSNYVYWYYEKLPDIKFVYQNENLKSISLLDPKKEKISIKVK